MTPSFLDQRAIFARAALEALTRKNAEVISRSQEHVVLGNSRGGHEVEIQVSDSTMQVNGMKGSMATSFQQYLDRN